MEPELADQFIELFGGLVDSQKIGAFGTGDGRWIKRPLRLNDVIDHLEGRGPGIGVPPLRPDSTVLFAAIDLDEPDFEAAAEMQTYLPGTSYLERSRSGNAHVWVFFSSPIEAYIPMGILAEAAAAAGKAGVEVFPKNHDFAKVRFGNYINLPYHGEERQMVTGEPVDKWTRRANRARIDPSMWRDRARWLMIEPPTRQQSALFGTQANLHMCAQHLIDTCEENPVVSGHRAVVYFSLAKMLLNWHLCDFSEALTYMNYVNSHSPDPSSEQELRRILENVLVGEFTSTGCDDPLFLPYAHPDCAIANGGR